MLRDVGLGPIASIFHSRENVRFRVNFGNAGLLPLLVICASGSSSLIYRHLHRVDKAYACGFAKCVHLLESFGPYSALCAHFLRIAIGDQTGHLVE